MKRVLILFLITTASYSISKAQNTKTRALVDFSRVSVGEAISLTLIPGNKNEAVIKANNIDLEDIETVVMGNKLRIGLSGSHYKNINISVELTYKAINGIDVSSAADVKTKGAIKAESLDISVSSAGDAELEVSATTIDIDVSSSGTLVLSGRATSQRAEVSSAGDYDGYDLLCEDVYVKAASAGSARVSVSKKIEAKASSAGSIKYRGNPDKVNLNSSSGGHTAKSH